MPNINLRLTEEEHEALRTWAFEGRRSIQREIIFRLFAEGATITGERPTASGRAAGTAAPPGDTAGPVGEAQRSEPNPIFRAHDAALPSPSAKSGKCAFNTPVGTKCKMCGKVHAL